MPHRHTAEDPVSPELEAIAAAAADRLRAHCGDNPATAAEHGQRVADAATAAIHAGAALSAIAEAERMGEERARTQLRADVLRKVERAARRKRETDTDYEHAINGAARLGLSHREIATAAAVSHGTVRAVLTRTQTTMATLEPTAHDQDTAEANNERASEALAA